MEETVDGRSVDARDARDDIRTVPSPWSDELDDDDVCDEDGVDSSVIAPSCEPCRLGHMTVSSSADEEEEEEAAAAADGVTNDDADDGISSGGVPSDDSVVALFRACRGRTRRCSVGAPARSPARTRRTPTWRVRSDGEEGASAMAASDGTLVVIVTSSSSSWSSELVPRARRRGASRRAQATWA